ncbi:hypothetical protein PHISCL_11293 [Aspergillus sclerotialis]|uniref:Uncharacterized protein n=1 Tax=Aspergillus sclerotialis TaxID=2070753 RepID=A0A3A2Z0V5_9EURO|nr:hypothetical protein PHISCL_11293 [Aspergillus sclerotialis]
MEDPPTVIQRVQQVNGAGAMRQERDMVDGQMGQQERHQSQPDPDALVHRNVGRIAHPGLGIG